MLIKLLWWAAHQKQWGFCWVWYEEGLFFPLFEKEDMRDERKSCVEMCSPYILSLPDTEKTKHF